MTSLDVTLDPVPNGARLIYVWRERTREEEEGATLKENVLFMKLRHLGVVICIDFSGKNCITIEREGKKVLQRYY